MAFSQKRLGFRQELRSFLHIEALGGSGIQNTEVGVEGFRLVVVGVGEMVGVVILLLLRLVAAVVV